MKGLWFIRIPFRHAGVRIETTGHMLRKAKRTRKVLVDVRGEKWYAEGLSGAWFGCVIIKPLSLEGYEDLTRAAHRIIGEVYEEGMGDPQTVVFVHTHRAAEVADRLMAAHAAGEAT